ncbi:hypothetical protein [Streptomyces sp. 2P-4]|uniref:hypothetical protein n=1 Tax=Streptomyces sp. 2P-4 TaxID=2931974 RepID=UPI00254085D7|nr:hypothetical protein [Streptomyces sp. 2P-4]
MQAVLRERRPDPAAWAAVVEVACGPPEDRWRARDAVMQARFALAPHADRLARRLGRGHLGAGNASQWDVQMLALALAGTGDARAMPALRNLSRADWFLIDARPLAALPAADLLPLVRAELRHTRMSTPDLLRLLADLGAAAAPAVPEVVPHLEAGCAYDAARVLGRIGPSAAAAAGRLAGFAAGAVRPEGPYGPEAACAWHGVRMAAWAHWRTTGDDALLRRACAADLAAGRGSRVLPYLADLGPAAAGHADAVRALTGSPGGWTRVAAAHAWWRITGDPEPAVPVLLADVDPDFDGHPAHPTPAAVRHLGAIGPAATAAVPVLVRLLDREERVREPWERKRILVDDDFTRALAEALTRITGTVPDATPPAVLPWLTGPGSEPVSDTGISPAPRLRGLFGWRDEH